jgi:hypothetical protein
MLVSNQRQQPLVQLSNHKTKLKTNDNVVLIFPRDEVISGQVRRARPPLVTTAAVRAMFAAQPPRLWQC